MELLKQKKPNGAWEVIDSRIIPYGAEMSYKMLEEALTEKERTGEARRNVKIYVEDGLLKTGDKDATRFCSYLTKLVRDS